MIKWHDTLLGVVRLLAARLTPGLLAGAVVLMVDAGLLDAALGRAVHEALRPSVSLSILEVTAGPAWAPRAW